MVSEVVGGKMEMSTRKEMPYIITTLGSEVWILSWM